MRFQLHLGLKIVQLTGDREANYHELAGAHIIMSVAAECTRVGYCARLLLLLICARALFVLAFQHDTGEVGCRRVSLSRRLQPLGTSSVTKS